MLRWFTCTSLPSNCPKPQCPLPSNPLRLQLQFFRGIALPCQGWNVQHREHLLRYKHMQSKTSAWSWLNRWASRRHQGIYIYIYLHLQQYNCRSTHIHMHMYTHKITMFHISPSPAVNQGHSGSCFEDSLHRTTFLGARQATIHPSNACKKMQLLSGMVGCPRHQEIQ